MKGGAKSIDFQANDHATLEFDIKRFTIFLGYLGRAKVW
jgi:hypothetical protein